MFYAKYRDINGEEVAKLYERGEENPYEFGLAVLEFDLEWLLNEE